MREKSVKPKKRLTKKELRRQKYEAVQKKQLEKAYEFPFCRRCRVKLEEKWAKKLKKAGSLPLCPKCHPLMIEQYKKLIVLWQKFNRR